MSPDRTLPKQIIHEGNADFRSAFSVFFFFCEAKKHPGRVNILNLNITQLKRKIIWTKPSWFFTKFEESLAHPKWLWRFDLSPNSLNQRPNIFIPKKMIQFDEHFFQMGGSTTNSTQSVFFWIFEGPYGAQDTVDGRNPKQPPGMVLKLCK